MNERFKVFEEGSEINEELIPFVFLREGYVEGIGNGFVKIKICGVINFNKEIYVFMPKGYQPKGTDAKEMVQDCKLFFEIMLNYNRNNNFSIEEIEWNGKHKKEIDFVQNIDWIIRDFQENGIYQDESIRYETNGKGRIQWQKTLNTKQPYIIDRNIVYLDVITKNYESNLNDMVRVIHNNIVKECINLIGDFYNLKPNNNYQQLNLDTPKQILVLKKKLNTTFKIRESMLLKNLISYLELKHDNNQNYILATPYFYHIWEDILKKLFVHQPELQKLMPRPYWEFLHDRIHTVQLPDILITHENNLIIIDAKYYSISTKKFNKLPGWQSIVKQIHYNFAVKEYFKDSYNMFIFPISTENVFEYIGRASVEGLENEYGYVYGYGLDIIQVFKYFKSRNNMKVIERNIISDLLSR